MKNKFIEKYVEENYETYYKKDYETFKKEYIETFKLNHISFEKTYSIEEIKELLNTCLKKYNGLFGLCYFKVDREKTGEEILNTLLKMKMHVHMSFLKSFGPDDVIICPECGKVTKKDTVPFLFHDNRSICNECRRKQFIQIDESILYRLYETDKELFRNFLKNEKEVGIDYSDLLQFDDGEDEYFSIIRKEM